MSKQSINTINLDYQPDLVMEVLCSPEFQKANFLKQGNPSAEVKEVSRNDNEAVIKAEVEEYAKGVTGVDKSRTEKTVTVYKWDLKNRKAEWDYDSPHGDRVKVTGSIDIQPTDNGCSVTEKFNVTVKIPLVGGKVEKKVIEEVEKYYPKYEALLKEHCATR